MFYSVCHLMQKHPTFFTFSFSSSVVTEGSETRQHRDAARHHPHREVADTGLRVPGEANTSSALHFLHDSHVKICKNKYIFNIHEPQEIRACLPTVSVPVASALLWRPFSLSLSPSLLSRTKTWSSTWTTVGTSWACRMSRWAAAGCLLAQPTSATSRT